MPQRTRAVTAALLTSLTSLVSVGSIGAVTVAMSAPAVAADVTPPTPPLAPAPATASARAVAAPAAGVRESHVGFEAASGVAALRPTSGRSGRLGAGLDLPATDVSVRTSPVVRVSRDVAVVGASWLVGTGAGTRMEYREKRAGRWGPWQHAGSCNCPACVAARAEATAAGTARDGSEAIVLVGAQAVQARIVSVRGAAARDARLAVVDPGRDARDARTARDVSPVARTTPASPASGLSRTHRGGAAAAALGDLAVGARRAPSSAVANLRTAGRAAWRADEHVPGMSRFRPVGITVHHTEGVNDYAPEQVPAILRGIQAFHVRDRGWSDIGYNALVDKWGRLWEGRRGGLDRPVVGAHARGYNSLLVGISVLGDYNRVVPSEATLDTLARAAARVALRNGFDPAGHVWLHGRDFDRIVGHRDVNDTECPGRYLYQRLPELRERAARYASE